MRNFLFARQLLSLVLLLVSATPLAAQRWSPPEGSKVKLINPFSGASITFDLELGSADPWLGLRWPNCGAPDVDVYAERYLGGEIDWLTRGWNCQGFANENAFLGAAAVSKKVCGTTICYIPLCHEVIDFNCTHQRTCAAYGLTAEDGCGRNSGGGTEPPADPPSADSMPQRLIEYCLRTPRACIAYRACDRTSCPCYTEQQRFSGAWVYYDPTRQECNPGQAPPVEPLPDDPGISLRCQQAMGEVEDAVNGVIGLLSVAREMCGCN